MQSGIQKENGLASMSAVRQYRENADECFTWARTARSDREREIFLEMARAWLDAATIASRRMSLIKPTTPLSRFQDNRKQPG